MSEPTERSAVDILLALLEKVPDAATLELLIEPAHLERLMRVHGVPEAEIQRDLIGRKRPAGELLLEVLAREPNTAVLLDLLGNPTAPVRPTKASLTSPALGRGRSIAALLFGAMLVGGTGWVLFVRLDFLHVPGLIVHFPGAYGLLFAGLVLGLMVVGKGLRGLRAAKP